MKKSAYDQGLFNKPFEVYDGEGIFGSKKDIMNAIRGELGRGMYST